MMVISDIRQTRTYAVLALSRPAWEEIAAKLREAGYDHAFMERDEIDMHGIAVAPDAATTETP